MSRFWAKNVQALTPYTPGEQPQLDNLIKLNTNENPYGPSPQVVAAIRDAADDQLRKYPDPNAQQLKDAIADYHQLDSSQVFVGNSSDEVLAHTFRALLKHDRPLLFPDITYSFYPVYCRLFEIDYEPIPLRSDYSIDLDDYMQKNGGIIFANPNAPTGLALDLDKIETFLKKNTTSVMVVDEAYVDFGADSAISLIDKFPNLLVTQTLSKSRSLAGLRVGFAIGDAQLIEALERVKNSFHPYTMDALSIAGAVAAFADDSYFKRTCSKIIKTRDLSAKKLKTMGFDVLESRANFVLVKHATVAAKTLFEELRSRGIVTRYFDKPRIDQFLRISIGTDQEMKSLIAAVKEIVATKR